MLEADKALLERTQNALDQCLAWLCAFACA